MIFRCHGLLEIRIQWLSEDPMALGSIGYQRIQESQLTSGDPMALGSIGYQRIQWLLEISVDFRGSNEFEGCLRGITKDNEAI